MKVLVLNAGSSSQKAALYDLTEPLPDRPGQPLWKAEIDWKSRPGAVRIRVETSNRKPEESERPSASRIQVLSEVICGSWEGGHAVVARPEEIEGVGHRVVHGGPRYTTSAAVTPEVKEAIREMAAFAPSHNPAALEGIEVGEQKLKSALQVAVFDTAFHRQMPDAARIYAGPYAWFEKGIHRYGFHGISHEYCAGRAAQLMGRDPGDLKLVTCHLGNGGSLAAVRGGRSVDTTMGLTPMDGLMMGSRSGSVDPGILIYLMRSQGYSANRLDETLNNESGLKGISGISSDMRQIETARAGGDARAILAFDMYVHRLRQSMGAMLAVLDGADALLFTGGIGEHSAAVRAGACSGLTFAGVEIDPEKNDAGPEDTDIATAASRVRVLVIRAEEDWAIARECLRMRRRGQEKR